MALEIEPRVISYDKVLRESSLRAEERIANMSRDDLQQKQNDAILRLGGTLEKQ